MTESEVQERFVHYLCSHGWSVATRNPGYEDLIAEKPGGSRLVAEVKGATSAPGLDVDTAYGQILRRMNDLTGDTRYALVVPHELERPVLRVSAEVLKILSLEIWIIPDSGEPRLANPR